MWLRKDKPERSRSAADEATLIGLNTELAKARAGLQALSDAVGSLAINAESARPTTRKLEADVERLTREIGEVTNQAATVGIEDATWEAIWAGIDISAPDFKPNDDGTQTFHVTAVVLRQMIAHGMTEDEARAKLAIGRRFDDLPLEQQRALVKAHVIVKVRATGRGSRPTERIDVEPV